MAVANLAHIDNRRVIDNTRQNRFVELQHFPVFRLLKFLLGDDFDGERIPRSVVERNVNPRECAGADLVRNHVIVNLDALLGAWHRRLGLHPMCFT